LIHRIYFTFLAFVLLCSSCSSDSSDTLPPVSQSQNDQTSTDQSKNDLEWTSCGTGNFECSTLRVPLDHDDAEGATIEIGLKRQPAAGSSKIRIGSLLINPGGPGASATDSLGYIANRLPIEVQHRFDIVAFDPRGVQESTPLDCHETLQSYIAADPSPDNVEEWIKASQVAQTFTSDCAEKHGDILPYLSTLDTVKDMDLVRAALGDDKLTYLGLSYGTKLGAYYAELFPDRTRALILDGAIDPALNGIESSLQQSIGFDQALGRYFDWCKEKKVCNWTAGKDPAKAYAELEALIDKNPLQNRQERPTGPGEFNIGTAFTLYQGEQGWQYLTQGLNEAAEGNGRRMLLLADSYLNRRRDGSYPSSQEAFVAVTCLDDAFPSRMEDIRALEDTFTTAAPVFGPPAVTFMFTCAHWPVEPKKISVPKGIGAPEILVIGTTGDPATPYQWAQAMASQLTSAVLLTYEGEGHVALGKSQCIGEAINDYLIELTLPKSRTC